jgi:dienelactone hydrolase
MSVVPERVVRFAAGSVPMTGDLWVPEAAHGLVLLADGRPDSRFDSHARHVARLLNKHKLATLLIDLLIAEEQEHDFLGPPPRFGIGMLVERVVAATDWIAQQQETRTLRLGYFGVGSGAGAALAAAALRAKSVGAVVSASGRPELAADALADVVAPALLIVGSNDPHIARNKAAFALLGGEKQLVIVPGAANLLEEPRALDQVATLARDWFLRYATSHPQDGSKQESPLSSGV